jgi:thiosulfate/3-mercaptopyruvate sulfurtransferase
MDILVSTDWLAENMGASDLRIVDASYFLPEMGRDASAEYEAQHIPGAVFLNLAELADTTSPLAQHRATAGEVRQPDASAGPRRWQPHRAL